MYDLISIIVPIYNVEKYLSKCIESILKQSYINFELILINDGSTDNSSSICEYYKNFDDRIILINKVNNGVSSARNYGLKVASGRYIGFVDADDYIQDDMYEKMYNCINYNNADLCICSKAFIDNQDYKPIRTDVLCDIELDLIDNVNAIKKILKFNFSTSLWATLYKKSCIEDIYLNETIHFWEDYEFQFRCITHCKNIAIYHEPVYHYVQRMGSANHQKMNPKIISCLTIAEPICNYINNYYPELNNYSKTLRLKFVSYVFLYIVTSGEIDRKYCLILHKEVSRCKSMLLSNNTLKEKIIGLGCLINSYVFCKFYKSIRKLKH
jgi:glycosyltransferase involved in cell wall biosynthesis